MNKNNIYTIAAIIVVGILVVLGFVWYKSREISPNQKSPDDKISIVTSFYPLYFFTDQIVGTNAIISNITPPGVEPHDYELTPRDVALLERSDLIIVNGGGLEPWAENISVNMQNKPVTMLFTAGELLSRSVEEDGTKQPDPHVWLDPVLAKKQVEQITQAVISLDPSNAHIYQQNTEHLMQRLDELDTEFRQSLVNCAKTEIVTSHAAFGYLTDRYDLEQISISGLSPDQEPSPQELANVADFARKHSVKYIFFETLVSPRIAETLASEIGAKTLVFNPLEGLTEEEQNTDMDYFSVQRENIKNIKIALECK